MATKAKAKLRRGDVAMDGNEAMVVIDGYSVPRTGQALYVGLSVDGGLAAQYGAALKATGANILEPGSVCRLDGADAFRASPHRIGEAAPDSSMMKALADQALELAPFVARNGKPGSELVSAFDKLESGDDDSTPGVFDVEHALGEWEQLPLDEQQRILGGWRPAPAVRSVRSFLAEEAGYNDGTVDFALVTRCHLHGGADVGPSWHLFTTTAPVQVLIRRGTRREEVMLAIKRAAAALERCWDEAIAMDDERSLRKFEASEFPVVTSGRRRVAHGTA